MADISLERLEPMASSSRVQVEGQPGKREPVAKPRRRPPTKEQTAAQTPPEPEPPAHEIDSLA